MKFASGMPYTEAERAADRKARWKAIERAIIRRRSAPRGKYDVAPTEQRKRMDERLMGELDQD